LHSSAPHYTQHTSLQYFAVTSGNIKSDRQTDHRGLIIAGIHLLCLRGVQWVGWSRNCSRKTLFTDRSLITSEISTSKHKAIRVPYSLQNGHLDIEKK